MAPSRIFGKDRLEPDSCRQRHCWHVEVAVVEAVVEAMKLVIGRGTVGMRESLLLKR